MGRQSKTKGNTSNSANELLNFHFTTPPAASSESNRSYSNSNNNNNNRRTRTSGSSGNNFRNDRRGNNKNRSSNAHRRSAEDSAQSRRKANSLMFPLHSSADHAFSITRKSQSKVKSGDNFFPFSGCDNPVAWDCVLIVTQLVQLKKSGSSGPTALDNNTSQFCPICLCDFVCARVTKCGHSFCLSCILRHAQAYTASNPYQHVKCPCCGVPLLVEEMKPVVFRTVTAPTIQNKFKLLKLHRRKTCSAPFLPLPDEPKHSSPNSAPMSGDTDSLYTRFNYVDPGVYASLLAMNCEELQAAIKNALTDPIEAGFIHMAIEIVLNLQKKADDGLNEELELQKRLASPAGGIYQPQSTCLSRENYNFVDHHDHEGARTPSSPEVQSPTVTSTTTTNFSGETGTTSSNQDETTTTESSSPEMMGRLRGDSICSYRSEGSHNSKRSHRGKNSNKRGSMPLEKYWGSMFLEDPDFIHFYQAEDGQLVFLSSFNMVCLAQDFSKEAPAPAPAGEEGAAVLPCPPLPPFPDTIEGNILDIENVYLTPEIRKRMPFLSHLPLFCDIAFVELDLNHILSNSTKAKFKADLQKRRKRRQHKVQAEKKADKAAMQLEAELINERKARYRAVDPNDAFFKPVVVQQLEQDGDDNAPASPPSASGGNEIGLVQISQSHSSDSSAQEQLPPVVAQTPENNALDFSRACRRAQMPVGAMTSQDFPTLGSSSFSPSKNSSSLKWNDAGGLRDNVHVAMQQARTAPTLKATPTAGGAPAGGESPRGKKKKGKGQKIMLFSTGGQRGMY